MGVDGDCWLTERGVQYNVSRLATDAGERFQCLSGAWYLAVILVNQNTAGLDDVLGLAVKKSDRTYVGFQTGDAKRMDCFGRRRYGVEFVSSLIDANIRRLGR